MTQAVKLYLILSCLILAVVILWSPLRAAVGTMISTILTPAVQGFLKAAALWIFWVAKKVVVAHWVILKNLFVPHRVIFPSLDGNDQRKL